MIYSALRAEILQICSNLTKYTFSTVPHRRHHRQSEIVVKDLFDLKRFVRFDFPFGRRAKPSREATPDR